MRFELARVQVIGSQLYLLTEAWPKKMVLIQEA